MIRMGKSTRHIWVKVMCVSDNGPVEDFILGDDESEDKVSLEKLQKLGNILLGNSGVSCLFD